MLAEVGAQPALTGVYCLHNVLLFVMAGHSSTGVVSFFSFRSFDLCSYRAICRPNVRGEWKNAPGTQSETEYRSAAAAPSARDEDAVPTSSAINRRYPPARPRRCGQLVGADDQDDARRVLQQPRERAIRVTSYCAQSHRAAVAARPNRRGGAVRSTLALGPEQAAAERAPGERRHRLGEALVERAVVERFEAGEVDLHLVHDQRHRAVAAGPRASTAGSCCRTCGPCPATSADRTPPPPRAGS